MSTARIPMRIPPIRVVPQVRRLNGYAKKKSNNKLVLWLTVSTASICFVIITLAIIAISKPSLASLEAQLDKAKSAKEQERIAAKIEALTSESKPVIQKLEFNKPYKISNGMTNFQIVFDSVWFYENNTGYVDKEKIDFFVSYTYKNLGPREGNPSINGKEVKTVKNHIFDMYTVSGADDHPGSFGMPYSSPEGIDKTGRRILGCKLPRNGEFPVEFSVCGDINGVIKLSTKIAKKRAEWGEKRNHAGIPWPIQQVMEDGYLESLSLPSQPKPKTENKFVRLSKIK